MTTTAGTASGPIATRRTALLKRTLACALAAISIAAAAQPSAPPAPKLFELALVDGKVAAAQKTLRVAKGDNVVLRWTSDRPIALHLHGYDIEATAAPQGSGAMTFLANIAGRFPVSEHTHGPGHHRAILYVEVHP
jgi:FtsP/CotA-like multicopper oxidase with cupredoxin domain